MRQFRGKWAASRVTLWKWNRVSQPRIMWIGTLSWSELVSSKEPEDRVERYEKKERIEVVPRHVQSNGPKQQIHHQHHHHDIPLSRVSLMHTDLAAIPFYRLNHEEKGIGDRKWARRLVQCSWTIGSQFCWSFNFLHPSGWRLSVVGTGESINSFHFLTIWTPISIPPPIIISWSVAAVV